MLNGLKQSMQTRVIVAIVMLCAGTAFAQLPARDGVLVYGHFVHDIGMLTLSEWPDVAGNISNVNARGLSISAGQLCAVNPDTGATITNATDLIPAVTRSLNVKHDAVVDGYMGVGMEPTPSSSRLVVSGFVESVAAPGSGGYKFPDTDPARRESTLETAYALVPVGGVAAFFKFNGWRLPENFQECNGQIVMDADSPLYGRTVPDINGQAATIVGNTNGAGTFVGANSNTLTEAQMPAHTHSASCSSDGSHTHPCSVGSAGAHTHPYWAYTSTHDPKVMHSADDNRWYTGSPGNKTTGSDGAHTHTLTIGSGGTHSHTIAVNNAGSGAAVDNRQRSGQLAWIIRIK